MNEILDYVGVEKKHETMFSSLSFSISIITFSLLAYFFISPSNSINIGGIPSFETELVIAIFVSGLVGIIMTIKSFYEKELSNWMKWISLILNSLLFCLIIGLILLIEMS